jgi:hypothetical protein
VTLKLSEYVVSSLKLAVALSPLITGTAVTVNETELDVSVIPLPLTFTNTVALPATPCGSNERTRSVVCGALDEGTTDGEKIVPPPLAVTVRFVVPQSLSVMGNVTGVPTVSSV